MATQYEKYTSEYTTWSSLDSSIDGSCQTFTAESTHAIGAVLLWLCHSNNPGNVSVYLTATDGTGKPTGGALASGTILEADIPEGLENATWVQVVFSSPYTVTIAEKYAIVLTAADSEAQKVIYIGRSTLDGGYSGGQIGLLIGGSTWYMSNSPDLLFRNYDESPVPEKPTNPAPEHAIGDVKLSWPTLTWESGS